MALSRSRKTENVQRLAAELEGSTSAIVGTFTGLTASKDIALRKAVRGAGGSYHVVKNKLAARAAQGTKIEAALQGLKGVSSVAYTSGDPVALAKALSTWIKDNAEFTFKLGIIDGKVISIDEIGELATMPGREELFSKLLFLINSPAQRLATVMNATGRDLAVVINQGVEKGKFAAAAETVTSPSAAAPASPSAEAPSAEAAATEAPAAEASATEAPAAQVPAAETPAAAVPVTTAETPAVEAKSESPISSDAPEAPAIDGQLVAETHAIEAPTPEEQIAEHPASEADPVAESKPEEPAQPENGTASQAGEAATRDPAEG